MAMFQPINFDLQAELQLAGAGPIKKYQTGPAAAVNSRHKTYSSKKGKCFTFCCIRSLTNLEF